MGVKVKIVTPNPINPYPEAYTAISFCAALGFRTVRRCRSLGALVLGLASEGPNPLRGSPNSNCTWGAGLQIAFPTSYRYRSSRLLPIIMLVPRLNVPLTLNPLNPGIPLHVCITHTRVRICTKPLLVAAARVACL